MQVLFMWQFSLWFRTFPNMQVLFMWQFSLWFRTFLGLVRYISWIGKCVNGLFRVGQPTAREPESGPGRYFLCPARRKKSYYNLFVGKDDSQKGRKY